MAGRFIGVISFRYTGNGKLNGPKYNIIGRAVMGIAESLHKDYQQYVFQRKIEGINYRVQKTINGDRIVYIDVPGGGCILNPSILHLMAYSPDLSIEYVLQYSNKLGYFIVQQYKDYIADEIRYIKYEQIYPTGLPGTTTLPAEYSPLHSNLVRYISPHYNTDDELLLGASVFMEYIGQVGLASESAAYLWLDPVSESEWGNNPDYIFQRQSFVASFEVQRNRYFDTRKVASDVYRLHGANFIPRIIIRNLIAFDEMNSGGNNWQQYPFYDADLCIGIGSRLDSITNTCKLITIEHDQYPDVGNTYSDDIVFNIFTLDIDICKFTPSDSYKDKTFFKSFTMTMPPYNGASSIQSMIGHYNIQLAYQGVFSFIIWDKTYSDSNKVYQYRGVFIVKQTIVGIKESVKSILGNVIRVFELFIGNDDIQCNQVDISDTYPALQIGDLLPQIHTVYNGGENFNQKYINIVNGTSMTKTYVMNVGYYQSVLNYLRVSITKNNLYSLESHCSKGNDIKTGGGTTVYDTVRTKYFDNFDILAEEDTLTSTIHAGSSTETTTNVGDPPLCNTISSDITSSLTPFVFRDIGMIYNDPGERLYSVTETKFDGDSNYHQYHTNIIGNPYIVYTDINYNLLVTRKNKVILKGDIVLSNSPTPEDASTIKNIEREFAGSGPPTIGCDTSWCDADGDNSVPIDMISDGLFVYYPREMQVLFDSYAEYLNAIKPTITQGDDNVPTPLPKMAHSYLSSELWSIDETDGQSYFVGGMFLDISQRNYLASYEGSHSDHVLFIKRSFNDIHGNTVYEIGEDHILMNGVIHPNTIEGIRSMIDPELDIVTKAGTEFTTNNFGSF